MLSILKNFGRVETLEKNKQTYFQSCGFIDGSCKWFRSEKQNSGTLLLKMWYLSQQHQHLPLKTWQKYTFSTPTQTYCIRNSEGEVPLSAVTNFPGNFDVCLSLRTTTLENEMILVCVVKSLGTLSQVRPYLCGLSIPACQILQEIQSTAEPGLGEESFPSGVIW